MTLDLLLDVKLGRRTPTYHVRVFHHEFFHLIDFTDDADRYRDTAWTKLNAKDFKYGSGGKDMQETGKDVFSPTKKVPGFLTIYGTSAVEEDKAELFSFMLCNNAYLQKRVKTDKILKAKLARMKKLLKAHHSAFNADFWKKLNKK